MKYFKIVYGYSPEDYLSVSEQELSKAMYLFLEGNGRGVFEDGAVRAQDIIRIIPDLNRAKGYNKGYKITPEDYQYDNLPSVEKEHTPLIEEAKLIAGEVLKNPERMNLLGMPIEEAKKELGLLENTEIKNLAEKLSHHD